MFSGGGSLRIPATTLVGKLGLLAAADAAVYLGSVRLQTVWKQVLKRPGSGRYYEAGMSFVTTAGAPRRVIPVRGAAGVRTRGHRASADGGPPASDTGALSNAVDMERRRFAEVAVGMGGRVGRIGLALEHGVNVPGSKVGTHPAEGFQIAPRPHARKALEEALPAMRADAETGAREAGR